jgi:hypothetical protein
MECASRIGIERSLITSRAYLGKFPGVQGGLEKLGGGACQVMGKNSLIN